MSLRKIRENHKWPKPKRNTFVSRYKRRWFIIDDNKELLDICFNKQLKNRQWASFIY